LVKTSPAGNKIAKCYNDSFGALKLLLNESEVLYRGVTKLNGAWGKKQV